MNKFVLGVVSILGVFCFYACDKDGSSSSSDPIETSYWKADSPYLGEIFVGFEEITAEDREDSPFEINPKYTNIIMIDNYQEELAHRQSSVY